MSINYLEDLKEEFSSNLREIREQIQNSEKLRKAFLVKFPINKLSEMTIEEYVIGMEDTFCYWLEQRLDKLGRIRGGSTADKKFGLYYGKTKTETKKKFRTIPKWGNSPEESFKKVKTSIIELLNYAKINDLKKISENKLSNNFKGKILATYFPLRYLNIFSNDHVEYFIDLLQTKYDRSKYPTIELKKELLLEIKNKDVYFQNLSNNEFVTFLYRKLAPPKVNRKNPKSLRNIEFADISKVKVKEIELKVNDIEDQQKSNSISKSQNSINEDNIKRIGLRGELIVLNYEMEFLRRNKKNELSFKVRDVSKKNLGYDILSYNLDGSEKKIEVKSTTASPPLKKFYITRKEMNLAKNDDDYIFYFLFNVNLSKPSLFKYNPFKFKKYLLEPLTFKVKMNSECNDA